MNQLFRHDLGTQQQKYTSMKKKKRSLYLAEDSAV